MVSRTPMMVRLHEKVFTDLASYPVHMGGESGLVYNLKVFTIESFPLMVVGISMSKPYTSELSGEFSLPLSVSLSLSLSLSLYIYIYIDKKQ